MKERDWRARKIPVELGRQSILQSLKTDHIRWPIWAMLGIAVTGSFWLIFSIRHRDQPDAESVEQATFQTPSDAIGEKLASNAAGRQQWENDEINRSGRGLPWNANRELVRNLSTLAAAGMTDEVEVALQEVAALGESVVPELKSLIQEDQSANVREAAAMALAEIGTSLSIATLLEAVFSEQNSDQRLALVSSLHSLNNSAPAAELAEALLKSQDPVIAPIVRDTLARVADAAATRIIAQTFQSDARDGWQQSNLLGALIRVNSSDAVSALREIVTQDTELSLRSQAAIALARIGTPGAVASLVYVIEARPITDLDDLVVQALLAVSNKDAEAPLYEAYQNTTNEVVKYATAEALAAIQGQTPKNSNAP